MYSEAYFITDPRNGENQDWIVHESREQTTKPESANDTDRVLGLD